MIPLPAVVKEWLQKSIWLTSYILILVIICFVSVSSYVLTWRFAVHLNRSLVELVGLVIEKNEVAHLESFSFMVVKRHFKSLAELQVFRSRKWSWSYFVACRHLWDANRYRWFYNLQFRSGMKTPINSFRNDLFRINFTLVSCENRYELVLEQN